MSKEILSTFKLNTKINKRVSSYLIVLKAMKHKNEQSLKRVENSKYVGHYHRSLVQVEEAESPRQSQKKHKNNGPTDPRSAKEYLE